jgi:hypothetical protein
MKKSALTILIGVIAIASPAAADTVQENSQKIQADIDAIHKDNDALRNDLDQLEKDRNTKLSAKATGDYGKQAAASVAIGADKVAIDEKKAEKSVDKSILKHHQNELNDKINTETGETNSTAPSNGAGQ